MIVSSLVLHSFLNPLLQNASVAEVTVSAGARVSSKGESSGESASKVTHITADDSGPQGCCVSLPYGYLPADSSSKQAYEKRGISEAKVSLL